MKHLLHKVGAAATVAAASLPLISLAQDNVDFDNTDTIDGKPTPAFTDFQGLVKIFDTLVGWILTIFFIAAAIFIIIAAFNYLTAQGEEDKIRKAKTQLIYAVVAIAVALVATAVGFVVEQLIGK